MGNAKRFAATLAVAAVGCGPAEPQVNAVGSLFLMNQTHVVVELPQYRATELDCVEVARDPHAGLEHTVFRFERCLTLVPAEVVSLDPEEARDQSLACAAVGLEGPGLDPHGLFWTDVAHFSYRSEPREDLVELVSVERKLVLDPPTHAAVVPLTSLPEHPCDWAN